MNYRYQNIQVAKSSVSGSQYYLNNVYPDIPLTNEDNYVITTLGDRLDLLAFDFYGDTSFWWVIASANALPGDWARRQSQQRRNSEKICRVDGQGMC